MQEKLTFATKSASFRKTDLSYRLVKSKKVENCALMAHAKQESLVKIEPKWGRNQRGNARQIWWDVNDRMQLRLDVLARCSICTALTPFLNRATNKQSRLVGIASHRCRKGKISSKAELKDRFESCEPQLQSAKLGLDFTFDSNEPVLPSRLPDLGKERNYSFLVNENSSLVTE